MMHALPPNEQISERQLREARDRFHAMLQEETVENDWQKLFVEHPYVLSNALPLRLEPSDIVPRGRPGRTEPDLIFYPQEPSRPPIFGMLELKRPDSPIITVTRKNVAILSRDAQTAVEQLRQYERQMKNIMPVELDTTLFLGNKTYLFAIMGRSSEIMQKLGSELYREMIQRSLPGNLQILPYDTLLKRFEQSLPPKILVLVPQFPLEMLPVTDSSFEKFVISDAGRTRAFLIERDVKGISSQNRVVFEAWFEAIDQWEAIPKMLKVMFHRSGLTGSQLGAIETMLRRRETSMSTGIGFGVAIPDAATDLITDPQLGFFQCPKGIYWASLDNQPATVVVCLLTPPGQSDNYLHALAYIAKRLHKSEVRQAIESAQTPEDLRRVILS